MKAGHWVCSGCSKFLLAVVPLDFRRLIRSFFESRRTLIRERLETLKAWQELDPTGAAKTAKAVYETTEPNADPELRYFCLNIGSNEDQTWAFLSSSRALGPERQTHRHELPLNIPPQEERATVIKRILPELARKNQGPDERVAQLPTLDPHCQRSVAPVNNTCD